VIILLEILFLRKNPRKKLWEKNYAKAERFALWFRIPRVIIKLQAQNAESEGSEAG